MSDEAAVYTRVSSLRQTDGFSLENQRELLSSMARDRGFTPVVFEDPGISGESLDGRPGLTALLAAISSGRFTHLFVLNESRLARDEVVAAVIRDRVRRAGVTLVTKQGDHNLSDPSSAFVTGILAHAAVLEQRMRTENSMRGLRSAATKGFWPGGPPPTGYQIVEEGTHKRLDINLDEQAMLEAAVAFLVDDACTTGEAAARLNAFGFKPRKAAKFTAHNLRRLLLDASLTGTVLWGRERRGAPAQSGPPVEIPVPAILAPDRHKALVAALARTTTSRTTPIKYLLSSGRLVGPCGAHFTGVVRRDHGTHFYRCNGNLPSVSIDDRCQCRRVSAPGVEQIVWDAVQSMLSSPDHLRAIADRFLALRAAETGLERGQIKKVDRRISELDRAIQKGISEHLRGRLDEGDLAAVIGDLEAERDILREHRQRLAGWEDTAKRTQESVNRLAEVAETASHNLAHLGTDDRARIIEVLDIRVTITGWDPCEVCNGKGKTSGGTGGIPCAACHAMKHVPHLLIEGNLLDTLAERLTSPSSVPPERSLHAVPFSLRPSDPETPALTG